ncbi:MAG TPA: hypothetical protein PLO67_07000 [Saprospiraceae bacterium]|nr:hypothetical protein [Saprospiraceae bacterium]HPI07017.1 hypothetical protein [Saprospiraceae bacterium]
MERYGHLWDFTAISTNDRIDWNLETITRFEDRIYWYFFSMNTGVKWTKTMLECFENRHLKRIRNRNRSRWGRRSGWEDQVILKSCNYHS